MGRDLQGNELGRGLYQRKDGLYQVRVYASGYSKPICFYGHDVDELKQKREKLNRLKKQGFGIHELKMTFGDWFELWMQTYKVGRIKTTTIRNYWNAYNCCKYMLENKKLYDLKPIHFQMLVNHLYEEGYKSTSVKPIISVIDQCLERAVVNRIISYNPCAGVILQEKKSFKPVKQVEKTEKCLTEREIQLFFEAIEDGRYVEVFRILLHTGMRSGELCALEWDDIDTDTGFIRIYKTLNRITKYYDESGMKLEKPEHVIQITTPKREASNRYIPMTDDVTEAFAIWKRKQEYDKKKLGEKWGKNNELMREYPHLIFTTTSGNCLTPGTLAVECRRICSVVNRKNREVEGCKEYEEIKIYPHLFRHTFVTRCYEAGVDPMTIALIVGHSREKMVNHYTHISKEFQKKDFVKYEEQEKKRILSDSE